MATLNLFEPLALEILLMIVTRLLDLVSLDSLARASPGIHRLFNDYAVGITRSCFVSWLHTWPYTCDHLHHRFHPALNPPKWNPNARSG
jgi:hypothetical protein